MSYAEHAVIRSLILYPHPYGIDAQSRQEFVLLHLQVSRGESYVSAYLMAAHHHALQGIWVAQQHVSLTHIALSQEAADTTAAHLHVIQFMSQHHVNARLPAPLHIVGKLASSATKAVVIPHHQGLHL